MNIQRIYKKKHKSTRSGNENPYVEFHPIKFYLLNIAMLCLVIKILIHSRSIFQLNPNNAKRVSREWAATSKYIYIFANCVSERIAKHIPRKWNAHRNGNLFKKRTYETWTPANKHQQKMQN